MEKQISVVIPNYNGQNLLAKNLPKVIVNCPDAQIIVVDDGSNDDSVALIKKNFPKVKLLVNSKNQGFAKTVNWGTTESKGKYVLLLNSDVVPRSAFLKSALGHFQKNNKNLFAVGLADYSHEGAKIIVRGRGGASFKRGFITHFALEPKAGETLWASGGSSIFDKQKYLELGGMDPLYKPFYWEDIDLSYRARKKGYICLFEPAAKVDHFHEEGAIKKTKSPFQIKSTTYKNQFLFVWKNISDYLLISQHLLWLPYHFIKAIISLDLPFIMGFLWAVSQIPQLIFNDELQTTNYKLTDKEVLEKFER